MKCHLPLQGYRDFSKRTKRCYKPKAHFTFSPNYRIFHAWIICRRYALQSSSVPLYLDNMLKSADSSYMHMCTCTLCTCACIFGILCLQHFPVVIFLNNCITKMTGNNTFSPRWLSFPFRSDYRKIEKIFCIPFVVVFYWTWLK